jgi:nitrite reductase (NO-forming)
MSLSTIIVSIILTGIALIISATGLDNANSIGAKVQNLEPQAKTHEYTLVAEETTLEIAPNLRVDAWTYNGSIPGPTLTATEGDRVIVHFINKTPLPHTVHFHGDHPSTQDGVFDQVVANGTYIYDFIATPAGALMYHCHVSPVMQHVRMGLYGAFIVYPKNPLPPAREFVLVSGEYDTQNQLNPIPEYYMFNGYVEGYMKSPLPVRTNETARIYLVNLGLSPSFGMHVHGTLFRAYPSGIWQNPPLKIQSWELGSGNAAILEAKWPWSGKFVFHSHGIPEERGAMGYFNVTNPPANAIDGKDIATTKSISMVDWQANLTRALQKPNPNATVTNSAIHPSSNDHGVARETEPQEPSSKASTSNNTRTSEVLILKGAATLGNKSYSPNPINIQVGTTIVWSNIDNNMHTVTSGTPNTVSAGELFDSGLTALIMPSKTYSHKFVHPGEFSYFCRVHPTMVGKVTVLP